MKILLTALLVTGLIMIVFVVCGCGFARHDIITTGGVDNNQIIYKDSFTVWTFMKNIDFSFDPNTIVYGSRSQNVKATTPYGIVETE